MTIHAPRRMQYLFRVVAPSTIALSWIISLGPQVQLYLLSILNSKAPTIYGSAYSDELVSFLPLSSWVADGINWKYLFTSLVIILFSIRDPKPRAIFWRSAISSFTILSLLDILFFVYYRTLSVSSTSENVISNLIGAPLISAILVLTLCAADFLYIHIPTKNFAKTLAASVAVLVTGFFFLCIGYYLADLFYNPLPVRLEAHLSAPFNGVVAYKLTDQNRINRDNSQLSSQSLIPEKMIKAEATLTSPAGHQTVTIHRIGSENKYNIAITLLSGSCTVDAVKKLKLTSPAIEINGVTESDVSFDKGMTILNTITQESSHTQYTINGDGIFPFWMELNDSTKTKKLTHFLGKTSTVRMESSDEERSFLLSAPVFSVDKGQARYTPRFLSVNSDKQTYSIKFAPESLGDASSSAKCAATSLGNANIGKPGLVTAATENVMMFASAFITVTRADPPGTLTTDKTQLLISSGGGWFALDPIEGAELEGHRVGTLNLIKMSGNINELALDNAPASARPLSMYTAAGELSAKYSSEGTLVISGLAKSLWKDSTRLNTTKWEKLAWEPSIFLLGLLFSATGWAFVVIANCLRKNAPFSWMN